jgi:sugar lactone lactonase YvrE
MVYDSYSNSLWIAYNDVHANGTATGRVMQIPISATTPPVFGTPTLFQNGNITPVVDGITSDGNGNLYLSAGLTFLVQYNIPTNTIPKQGFVNGIDSGVLVPEASASAETRRTFVNSDNSQRPSPTPNQIK